MIDARVLWVLAQLGSQEAGDLRAARRQAYAQIDPLLRGLVRARVERAAATASFETQRADDERHVHRLAYLELAGRPPAHADDVDAVAAQLASTKPRLPLQHGPTLALAGSVLMLALAGSAAAWWWTRPPASLHVELAPTRGAFVHGGRPQPGDERARALFARTLPAYVVALTQASADDHRELDRRAARVLAEGQQVLGADATSYLRAVLEQSRQIVLEEQGAPPAADSHLRSVDALNAAIASRDLGYYVDAQILTNLGSGGHRVYLSSFSVERVVFYRSGSERVRALRLRRLDPLNFARGVLGFTRPQVRDGLVLMERIERYLVGTILAALAPGGRMELADAPMRSESWAEAVERATAEDARRELGALLDPSVLELGTTFARRVEVFAEIRERIPASEMRITVPRGYDFDREAYRGLEDRVPHEWRELGEIQSALESADSRGSYRNIEEIFATSIEHHEVQHRLDFSGTTLDAAPDVLTRYVGPLHDGERDNRLARHAVAELSAYTSELARGPAIVKTNLALLLRHALNRRHWGTAECYVALVVIEGLADRAHVPHGELVTRGEIDRPAVATLFLALRTIDDAALARSAAELWHQWFGRALPELRAL